MLIRLATDNDCYNLAALSAYVWLQTYAAKSMTKSHIDYVRNHFTPVQYQQLLDSKSYRVIAVIQNANLVGLAVVNLKSQFENPCNGFEIERMYIHPSYRGAGYGRAIFDYIKSQLGGRFWLYTWDKNESNAFYQHLGFSKVGEHQFYFANQVVNNNVFAYVEEGAE
ncbi:GNAT family N-acetyltransferase [Alteromonas sp. ASW11-36]|uniref:GNAT family N-acetyltransferase n=1 Tax=Alteromonas arenosi TaxID=3055817 RepID=A0ABT7T1I5_9ALTE|nr:GNAT family N-acetyltransferase [Alteromonas sp. ASW11-36]MDM7862311.1 GNAT family N-acetyltransferase [Alteromonas sp. ASW11-36]